MNSFTHLLHITVTGIISHIRSLPRAVWATGKKHPRKTIAALVVIVAGVLYLVLGGTNAEAPSNEKQTTHVRVQTVADLAQGSEPLTLLGEVRSQSEADLRAQKSGQVTRVYVRAGQYTAPGALLGEIENQSERAAVLQAQGAVAAAEAQLAKLRGGARSEDRMSATAQADSAIITLLAARDSAQTAYGSAYSAAYDAVFAKADTFFTSPYTVRPSFRVRSASYDERQVLGAERVALGDLLSTWKAAVATPISPEMLDTKLREAQADLERVKAFLDSISGFVSEQTLDSDFTAADKAAQEGTILAARSEVDGARGAVSGARQALANAASAQAVTSLTESKLVVGAQSEDIQTAEAGVTQARAGLAAAQAALERSLIRTPIGGTVSTLAVQQGDFVNPGQVLAVVANKNALEVEVSVSDDARALLVVGATTTVDGAYTGIITSIEPGLDPVTKKSRVHIGLPANTVLTNGQYVSVSLANTATGSTSAASRDGIAIPIEAIKVLPSGLALFTVNEEGILEAYPIAEGAIVGDHMLVKDGVTLDLLIVTDVRGLSVGESVTVDANS